VFLLDAFLEVWNGLCCNLDGVEEEDKDGVVWSYGEGIQHVFNKGRDK
jgi:hypothetical protein